MDERIGRPSMNEGIEGGIVISPPIWLKFGMDISIGSRFEKW